MKSLRASRLRCRRARTCKTLVLVWVVTLVLAVPSLLQAQQCYDATSGIMQLDYSSVQITPEFRLNGQPFSTSAAQSVQIWLAQDGVLQVLLGETHTPPQPVYVVAGTYDLVYRDITADPAPLLPANTQGVFQRDVLVNKVGKLVANVETATLSGNLTLNGAAFPASNAEDANIYAVGRDGEGEVLLYNTHEQGFVRVLLAGEYDIVYRHESGTSIVPVNQNASGATMDLLGPESLAVNVVSYITEGDFLFNGAPAPASEYERGSVELRRSSLPGQLDVAYLGDTNAQSYSRPVIGARYGAYYQHVAGTSIVPVNGDTAIPGYGNRQIDGSTLDIDILSSTYSGDFTFNGATPPTSEYEHGEVVFVDRQTGAVGVLGRTSDGDYDRAAIPGTYDLAYRELQADNLAPNNLFKRFEAAREFANGGQFVVPLDVDIPITEATVTVTLGGAPWNAIAGNATLRLLEAEGNHAGELSWILGETNDLPWEILLVSGTYRVLYSHETGNGIPRNALTELSQQFILEGATHSASINLEFIDLTPSALLNGGNWPVGQTADLSLLMGGGLASLGSGAGAWPARRLLQGQYRALYSYNAGATIPRNVAHQQPCISAEFCLFCDGFETTLP